MRAQPHVRLDPHAKDTAHVRLDTSLVFFTQSIYNGGSPCIQRIRGLQPVCLRMGPGETGAREKRMLCRYCQSGFDYFCLEPSLFNIFLNL